VKKAIPYILLLLLAIAVLLIKRCHQGGEAPVDPAKEVNRNHGLDRRTAFLEYTKHALCRMDCRHITEEEIKYILLNGKISYRKSDVNDKPCPTYAVEGYSTENQHLRVVFAQCDHSTKVVTCIDLDHDFECHCPGDDNKHEQ